MITLEKVTKRYAGSARASVEDLDLDIMQGEFLCLLGPSGCGKSTTLRMIAGLEALSAGRISIDGTVVDDVASGRHVDAERRGLGFVFQNYALWPHLTVAENVAFGPRVQRVRKAERRERVGRALDALGITALADRIPSALSGGQQQRVAIARTLAARPSAMLLDEPLSNLDAKLRLEMRGEFQRVHRESGATMVFVTHDQFEAMTLATRIVVMNAGAIQQIGTPAEIYDRPVNLFVAEFMGSPPITIVRRAGDGSSARGLDRWLAARSSPAATAGIRPEAMQLSAERPRTFDGCSFDATVSAVLPTGGSWITELHDGPQRMFSTSIRRPGVAPGERVTCLVSAADLHLFDDAGDRVDHERLAA
ncbi:MAG TPA: ABC transporter ATP-binding protein [Candidatus Microbacterium stercoravium]|uniref:ABC transporter ATP-binding protein n=1 Tax=Candidatus Microbacterium stercoravium TaxID=2838697 RepID=A0A9D2H663_9MICO|nr:ABC transporter ATP-binding protein [Candidatus Microbacterium stercoravium]